jgi:MarR family transcriptional regulator for hemolysin
MEESLPRELIVTAKLLRRRFESSLERARASLPTWIVLRALRAEPGLNQRQLAGRIFIEGPTLTRHLDRMEAAGLITRRPYPADRRAVRVETTPEGARLYDRLLAIAGEAERRALSGFSKRDEATLRRLLARIQGNLEQENFDAAG